MGREKAGERMSEQALCDEEGVGDLKGGEEEWHVFLGATRSDRRISRCGAVAHCDQHPACDWSRAQPIMRRQFVHRTGHQTRHFDLYMYGFKVGVSSSYRAYNDRVVEVPAHMECHSSSNST